MYRYYLYTFTIIYLYFTHILHLNPIYVAPKPLPAICSDAGSVKTRLPPGRLDEAMVATGIPKWVFPKIGVPQNGWFIMEHPIKMDELGVPLFFWKHPYNWD